MAKKSIIKPKTRSLIKGYLEGFIQGIINEKVSSDLDPSLPRPSRTASTKGDIKPFHEAMLPHGILLTQEFERTFSTKLGSAFEEVARFIGADKYKQALRSHRITGIVSEGAAKVIDTIKNSMETGLKESYPELVQKVLAAKEGQGEERTRIADLYLQDDADNEFFFEMKSPKPNKGQCIEVTERLLLAHAITQKRPPRVRTYFAMAYNPYGIDKSLYRHSFALRYLDMDNEVLLGKEFWDLVGEHGTYEEVLEIFCEVGREKGPDMIDQLALRY